ncbi:MAG: hypothetical protein ACM3X4_05405 [Ignavibacteriales bacterium]
MADKVSALAGVMDHFHGICPGVCFSVLFKCGDCCFKATDVADIDICDDVAVLKASPCDFICVFSISPIRAIKEMATAVAIPVDNVCAVEAQSPECKHKGE